MVRVFIGIGIPEDIKSYLIELKKKMCSLQMSAKFVETENFHINLSFIGEISENDISDISDKLAKIAKKHAKITVKLGDILLLPDTNFVRIIALDAKCVGLENLRKEINETVNGESHPPHLTICRVKSIVSRNDFLNSIKNLKNEKLEFDVNSVSLYRSVLGRTGPVYSKIKEFNLG